MSEIPAETSTIQTRDTTQELSDLITRLQAERKSHVDAVARIDAAFEQFGKIL